MPTRLEVVNAVTARNELIPGLNTSVIRLNLTSFGIVDPLSGKRIEQTFCPSSRETQVNLAMLAELEKRAGVGVWLSPPSDFYDRGKILIAVKDKKQVVEYDITGQTFSGKDFASFMTSLSTFHRDGYYFLPDMEVLEAIIPMPLVWQGIKNDQAEAKFNREVEEAMGHKDIRMVYQKRHGVDIDKACPTRSERQVVLKIIGPDGKVKIFAKNCGVCGGEINAWIHKGYRCRHCGREYLGVC